mgnify:CR=1 FL=1
MTKRRPHDWYARRLAPPRTRPRVVIDTDAANEIDDQFALTWALLSPERLDVLAVYAAPFSFEHRRQEMLRALAARAAPERASAFDLALLAQHGATLGRFAKHGWAPDAIGHWPVFCAPGDGMQRSFDEIVRMFELLRLPHAGRVFRGSAAYLADEHTPLVSDAVEHLITAARATPALTDGTSEPLYVVAIGCVTNIASALPAPAVTPGMFERCHRRQRMHRGNRPRRTEMRPDALKHLLDIGEEILPHMPLLGMQRVLAVIAHVERNEIVGLGERQPERRIGVDRKPVAVTEYDPRRARPSIAAQTDNGAILHREIGACGRRG